MTDLAHIMPQLRGRLRENASLAKVNWFQVGGEAHYLFKPEGADDLAYFMAHRPAELPLLVVGVGSNLLVRDGGIEGVVIRLGRGFTDAQVHGDRLVVGAGCLNANATAFAQAHGVGGLEFLSGIPGTIGGALAMNAGAYGRETRDVLIEAEVVDGQGNRTLLTPDALQYSYRHCALPEGWVFTRATLQGKTEAPSVIAERMKKIADEREATQPIHSRTGGSTFKNPPQEKAWRLIDEAGCRGLMQGAAQMSPKHCNFMINTGGASAHDLETLGEEVRRRVFEHAGVMLEWEIKRVGKALAQEKERAVA